MKKYLLLFSILSIGSQVLLAKSISFFEVSAEGAPANLSMTLCLNGKGMISCQQYKTSSSSLSIRSTIPSHTYDFAGIKINTPGYQASGCQLDTNGYCLFSVNDKKASSIQISPTNCQASLIQFSPEVTFLDNPSHSEIKPSQQITINMTLCNSLGQVLIPSTDNPLHVEIYGAPSGTILPTSITSSSNTISFTYNGHAFPNNIALNAWIKDPTNHGAAIGVTQLLPKNPASSCLYGTQNYHIPLVQSLPNSLAIMADVGHNENESLNTLNSFTIDTGSLGLIVPKSELPNNALLIGPGAPGVKYYNSSGNTYAGHYYLAPIRIQTDTGIVLTHPIPVLAIDRAYCMGPKNRSCYNNPPDPNLHYMGVGFDRNSTTSGDLFNSPSANPFLHIINHNNGTDINPGYYLTPADTNSVTNGLTLGITNIEGYDVIKLTPNTSVPGDFKAQTGCYSFPNTPFPNQFCGTALLDVGIDYMFIDLPKNRWPSGTYNAKEQVPAAIDMNVLMGKTSSPAMSYDFRTSESNPPNFSPAPVFVQWIVSTASGKVFVNTGRRPLYLYNYFYEGQCGRVGFKRLP